MMDIKKFNDIHDTVNHFESLKKRYIKTNNEKALKRIEDALEALYEFMFLYDTLNLYGSSLTLRYRVDRRRVDKDKNNNITLEVIE